MGDPVSAKHVQPQHAAACRSMPQHPFFGAAHRGLEACCSIQFFEFMCLSACSCSVDPELLQTKEMTSYSELCKHIPNVPQSGGKTCVGRVKPDCIQLPLGRVPNHPSALTLPTPSAPA